MMLNEMMAESVAHIDRVPVEQSPPYALAVVVPTRNECANIMPLLAAVHGALDGIVTEVIFVDDSDDETPSTIAEAAKAYAGTHLTIALEHRPAGAARAGGLASAVEHGMRMATAPYLAVIDADLQHPPADLRRLYDTALAEDADVVIATRYRKGGSYEGLDGISRRFFSVGLKTVARFLFPEQLLHVSDPLSGFFLLRTSLLDGVTLRPIGYKIGLEVLIRTGRAKLVEVPYRFQKRLEGTSKSDFTQGWLVLRHMARLWREVPAAGRFWKFCAVGASGTLVNLILFAMMVRLALPLWFCWLGATEVGLLNNFALNSWLTWRDHQREAVAHIARLGRYHIAMAGSILVNLLLFAGLWRVMHQPLAAQALALLGGTLVSYWLAKNWVFTASAGSPRIMLARLRSALANPRLQANAQAGAALAVLLLAAAVISRVQMGGWMVIAALLLGAAIVLPNEDRSRQTIIMVPAIVTGVAAIDYITWRFSVTNWADWWIAVPLVLAEAFGVIHTIGLQVTIWPWPEPELKAQEDPTIRPVFVFIPTVNEGVQVVEPTVRAALVARDRYREAYPHGQVTIVICNDGRKANVPGWQQIERLARRLGVICITRTSGGGAKAGNIEHARQQVGATGDALIAIFDADQVAKPDFLIKMIAPFADASVGWVQSGQYYGNRDNPVARWAHDQQALFYQVLCPGKAAQNAAFICGTNVMLRAAALDAIGGLPQDSVTEDFAASIALHPTWRSIFLREELATGLGPMDLPAYLKQQRRWAIGTLGVLRAHWRAIFLPQRRGLSLAQRFHYFLACTHYLCGLRDTIYIIAPVMFLATGIPAVRGSTIDLFLWHFLPYWLASLAAFWYIGRGVTGIRGVTIGFGSFPYLLESLATVIANRSFSFTITAKQRAAARGWRHLTPHFVAFVACLIGLVLAFAIKGRQPASVAISVCWILYAMTMLGGFFWLAARDMGLDRSAFSVRLPRWRVALPAWPRLTPSWRLLAIGIVLVVATSGSVAWVHSVEAANNPDPFIISTAQKPIFGLALPAGVLRTQPTVLAQELHTSFGIIGRTQTIQDSFDTAWADQLAAQHAYPWITLQFGRFGADGRPPLDASLVAIANGVHDQDLRRWAEAIRDYGQPVLLTVLLHVDRNWALSSAVANGGIPADAPRAWLHIQAVFRSVGATNVAWVWSPADPAHDQLYAPPANSIDAVLLSLISYPGTTWANPQVALAAVRHRYPTKPIMLEVSADGPPKAKARWLAEVGQAVMHTSGIFALIYHEGTPAIVETAAGDHAWSLASDPLALAAIATIVQHLSPPAPTPAHVTQTAIIVDQAVFEPSGGQECPPYADHRN
jgi:cellulose synthase/poly-beta-1,6-N-acetylglucosamine synthase-like glycosyltransferase/putative flippase GtrA